MAHRESQPAFPHRGHSGQVGVTTRRDALFLLIAASLARPRPAQAADNVTPDIIGPRHGLSAFGDLKYPARSEEHTSELQSLMRISYAVFCLKKKKQQKNNHSKNANKQTHNGIQLNTRTSYNKVTL